MVAFWMVTAFLCVGGMLVILAMSLPVIARDLIAAEAKMARERERRVPN
jgi:hypothetical protein